MSMESLLFNQLSPLVGGRVYPGEAPEGVMTPYIVYQHSGGQPVNFYGGEQPSKRNARMQVSVWSSTLAQALSIAQEAETALRACAPLNVTVLTQFFTNKDDATKRHGTYQFFSCWSDIS
ncbi:DUF3168 domain-containing protein [Duganella sp.]|uniref:DUF3168 domain-containing protein n=1 Tax=Duganella sp. TaxID=1904440 RepID=UPI0031E119B9